MHFQILVKPSTALQTPQEVWLECIAGKIIRKENHSNKKRTFNKKQMLSKSKLIQTINDLPDKFTLDDLLYRIVLLQKIEIGLEQSAKMQTKSTKQAKEKLKKWLE